MTELLPYNATGAERALADATARISDVPVPIRDTWNPDTCPPQVLAWLAWAFSVDQWDDDWTDAQKRDFIKSSVDIHRHKGTIGAVREALGALAIDAEVQEWFSQTPAGDPFTFRLLLTVEQAGIDEAGYGTLLAVIDRTKNLRSHLTEVALTVRSEDRTKMAVVAGTGQEICLTGYLWPSGACNETTICF